MAAKDLADFDVIVVGCGAAGLSAAVAALEAGARVAVLERAIVEERGGQTRWTESMMRMKSETETSDDFIDHFAANSSCYRDPSLIREAVGAYSDWPAIVKTLSFTDPELVSVLATEAGPTLAWLKGFGLRFAQHTGYFITTCTPRLTPVGGGLAIIEALAAWAEKSERASFYYCTTARRLLHDQDGHINGVQATTADGDWVSFSAKAVILASGGFEGNEEMMTRYFGGGARYIRPVARGGYYNKGEGIRMALAMGAAPSGDYSLFHAEPLDPRSGATEPVVMVFSYGILVNKHGKRFVDEAPTTVDATYESITRQIGIQPDGIAWVILDSQIEDVPNWRRCVRSDQPPVTDETLDGLARKLGLNAAALSETVKQFNEACGPGAYDPLNEDGLSTRGEYMPRKSNWARKVNRGPFLAFPIICGICFTFGGIKVDSSSRVLDTSGVPIKGLYAAGEMTGMYYGTYTGSTSVLRSVVFGRIAGTHTARLANLY